jgi:hypothetical protein
MNDIVALCPEMGSFEDFSGSARPFFRDVYLPSS